MARDTDGCPDAGDCFCNSDEGCKRYEAVFHCWTHSNGCHLGCAR